VVTIIELSLEKLFRSQISIKKCYIIHERPRIADDVGDYLLGFLIFTQM
jgi:hypothetical protein